MSPKRSAGPKSRKPSNRECAPTFAPPSPADAARSKERTVRNPLPPVQLPQPRNEEWEWQIDAACRSMPISMFFPRRGLRGSALTEVVRNAKLICAQCPVIERCLQHALDCGEPYGIWGGLTVTERSRWKDTPTAPEPTRQALKHTIGPPRRPYKKVTSS
ncbi:WhiB family transcriptional regulator [Rhodococcus sp. IEGM 1374]|nr:WhiB family transcriptional regulator [Rhodococcus sp. IEGM 1374]KAA0923960.1 WhiB family transcriptional regulator [Rhodococcus sp. ANT_H53B]MDV7991717.1 WhiB family transcriptional regulator [Rhodococcus sp. IEGM 1374]